MANWTKSDLKTQFNRAKANGWVGTFISAALKWKFPPEILLAIASRESNIVNKRGDFRKGRYNGYGLMQLDIGSHKEWIESGAWKDPNLVIHKGAEALWQKRREVANYYKNDKRKWTEHDLLRTAIASYNHGSKDSYHDLKARNNPDEDTTGHDYSTDVLKRAEVFKELLATLNLGEPVISNNISDFDSATTTPAELPTESPNLVQSGTVSNDGPPAPTTPEVVVGATGVDKSGAKKSWIAVVFAALATIGINTWDFFATGYQAIKSNPIAVVISVATIAAICFIYGKYQDRQTKLDEAREQRAHEINMAKLKYAADKNSNTVELVPAVVPAPNPMESKQ